MNRTKLKNYAPQARRDFIQAMTDRAAYFGLTADKTEPIVQRGDVAVIAGREHPRAVAVKRKQLEDRIKRHGFEPTMEAMAYTWFNRLVAIRFMELHGYLEHGYRVLSHPEGKLTPEILEHAEHVELPGLKKDAVIDFKLAGNKEGELYRLLLTAQCNALHTAMPFLFEKVEDETELLLPDNLLNSDSLIRKLVSEIEEEDWKEVEIIGWMYQFYISEKKDEVIGKVVASEDIPAATQLFTPNWIVKYLVQNTLGRQWLATYPQSALRQQMAYCIEPAEQTPEVQEHLKTITPTSLNPEELTLLDPACGSGHILVEAYDLFKAIYQERGYRVRDIPALILQKNLFGLEIDDRAAQLAAFALMMKARADDRRIFDSEAKPNVMAIQASQGMNAADLTHALNSPINKEDAPPEYLFEEIQEEKDGLFNKKALAEKGHVSQGDVASLLSLFENAKTLGSLIQIPPKLAAELPEIEKRLDEVLKFGDLTHASAHVLKPLLQQGRVLARQYNAVVANPPYMGSKFFPPVLKRHIQDNYSDFDKDLFSSFIARNRAFSFTRGEIGVMSPFTWMFIASHQELRDYLLNTATPTSLIQLEYSGFAEATVPICTFTLHNAHIAGFKSSFVRLSDFKGADQQGPRTLEAINDRACPWRYVAQPDSFKLIPGSPFAYWVSDRLRDSFADGQSLNEIGKATLGMNSTDNAKYVRLWHEVEYHNIGFDFGSNEEAATSDYRWFPYNKGGEYRKWYGNREHVINWHKGGKDIHEANSLPMEYRGAPVRSKQYQFKECITWSFVSSSFFGVRYSPKGSLFDVAGSSFFAESHHLPLLTGFLCSPLAFKMLQLLNPTLNFQVGNIASLPVVPAVWEHQGRLSEIARDCIRIAKIDWDRNEQSWDFQRSPLLYELNNPGLATIQESFEGYRDIATASVEQMRKLEEENNRILAQAYGLSEEMRLDVPEASIKLNRADREEDIKRLLLYAIGCMMGRYSLDMPGLIYANSGNQGFDPSQYKTFRADDDGIIPLLETDWGIRDDATNRLVEFIGVAWPKEHLEENLKFVADSLGPNNGEQARETIRRYLATGFYKHHLSMYKKRPIYWLFSSGKHQAFQCLVYLHRYHEGTLARMRTEYVIPLQGQISARIEHLEGDKAKATSTSHRKKLQKEQDDLKKQQAELLVFEEKLKHAADHKISLDLDDGVKVNYAKFGDLLAESKAITGGRDEE